ncbi:MAG TPA: glutaminyl-peptide cyclotransferase [Cyclobacteriaceae bacterium]|jgi:glutamine cyclotransferase|nr:glutaminyl-peptide cyclotransferase [Cyclobacteriaceae bacterium]
MIRIASVLVLLVLFCCSSKEKKNTADNLIAFELVKGFPHDVNAFTQGLVVENGKLFESTGREGSWIAEVDLISGAQNKKVVLDDKYFGEGITFLNNKVYQLTWQNKEGFVYDAKTFTKLNTFTYTHEGWGITHDGKSLIVSDGTDVLHVLDTVTLKDDHVIHVTDGDAKVDKLNELEFVDGFIYANIWQTAFIVKIDPANGKVVGRMDLSSLGQEISKFNGSFDVLNGIAYEKKSKLFLVTGKLWPVLFALRLKN